MVWPTRNTWLQVHSSWLVVRHPRSCSSSCRWDHGKRRQDAACLNLHCVHGRSIHRLPELADRQGAHTKHLLSLARNKPLQVVGCDGVDLLCCGCGRGWEGGNQNERGGIRVSGLATLRWRGWDGEMKSQKTRWYCRRLRGSSIMEWPGP